MLESEVHGNTQAERRNAAAATRWVPLPLLMPCGSSVIIAALFTGGATIVSHFRLRQEVAA